MLSLRHHAIALIHGLDERRFAGGDHPDLGVAAVLAVAVFGLFLWLSIRRLRMMDVP